MIESFRIPFACLCAVLVVLGGCPETEKTPVDGGGCAVLCSGATPHCDSATALCVACTSNAHCQAPTPTCDTATHGCIGCTSNDQCTEPATPVCIPSTGACGGCTADADCARFAAAPVCDEPTGRCVACTADTEATRCAGKACHPTRFECLTYARGTQGTCQPCAADVECQQGRACLATSFQGQPTGSFCLLDQNTFGCGDTNAMMTPYSRPTNTTSVDGRAATYCLLPPTTTCAGKNEFGNGCSPGGPDTCGIDGVADAVCDAVDSACTYSCTQGRDCPYDSNSHATLGCVDTPTRCAFP